MLGSSATSHLEVPRELTHGASSGGSCWRSGVRELAARAEADGIVQIKEGSSPSGVDALLVDLARVDGDVQAEKNYVGGSLQSKENSPRPIIRNNFVQGDLEVG
jgi:hypothetical protein